MKIAQIAPLWEKVPPPTYGGTELVVSLLTEELVRRGYDVTLFASSDSETLATLDACCDKPLRPLGLSLEKYQVYEQMQLSNVFNQAQNFDLIHSHVGYSAFPYANLIKTPVVHTLHGIIPPWMAGIFQQHCQQNFVTISDSQRRPELGLNYVATVYNAIALSTFQFYPQPQDPPYLAFLGRMSPEKGPQFAIEIAKQTQYPLKMAGKIDRVDQAFFQQEIAPHIDGKQIQFLGEANHEEKNALLGGAIATLFPITWREPFGLVTIESLACGTPVIAMAMGATSEIITPGETGFLCRTVEDCITAVSQVSPISRHHCRTHVAENFNLRQMTDGYEAVYQTLLRNKPQGNGRLHPPVFAMN